MGRIVTINLAADKCELQTGRKAISLQHIVSGQYVILAIEN